PQTHKRHKPFPTDHIQIFVRGNKTLTYLVSPEHTVEQLKVMIQDREFIPVDQQTLIYAGKLIDGDVALGSCGVGKNSTLFLSVKLRGC
ncbi:ribosomal 40S subunit protein S27A, partial [Rhizophlyctis rosea]